MGSRTSATLCLMGVVCLFIVIILVAQGFSELGEWEPADSAEYEGTFGANESKEVHLAAGDYDVYTEKDRDVGRVTIADQFNRTIFDEHFDNDTGTELVRGDVTYLLLGNVSIRSSATFTIQVHRPGRLYISTASELPYELCLASCLFFLMVILFIGALGAMSSGPSAPPPGFTGPALGITGPVRTDRHQNVEGPGEYSYSQKGFQDRY